MTQIFATNGLPNFARLEFWHDVVCRAYAECDGVPLQRDTEFNATTEVGDLSAAKITSVTSDPIVYKRSKRDISRDGREDLFVQVVTDGHASFSQNGRRVVQRTGDILVYDSGQPYAFTCEERYSALLLRLGRKNFHIKNHFAHDFAGMILRRDAIQAKMISGLMESAMNMAKDTVVSETIARPMIELLVASFTNGLGISDETARHVGGKLQEVKRYMIANLEDDTLNLERIANAVAMSPRSLTRLFAEAGETPMAWLQSARLARAHRALESGQARSVTEASFDVGFRDISHFGRAFKKAYGVSPKSLHRRLI